jgi:hypothetical protein
MTKSFVAALLVAIGIGGTGPVRAPVETPQEGKIPNRVLGILWNQTRFVKARLAQLDPLSLERVGRPVALRPGGGSVTAASPNGRLLAIGTDAPGIQVIDVRRMKEAGFVTLGGIGWVTFLSWQGGTLFAIVSDDTHTTALVIDPQGEQVLQRHRLNRLFLAAAESNGGIAVLTAPPGQIGPLELSVLGGKGMASVAVSEMVGGWKSENNEDGYRARQVTPGLAIDQNRALIVSAGNTVGEVSLSNLAVSYHTLAQPVSLLGRVRNWLEPAAEAKLIEGPQRKAVSLANGLVAVTGADYTTVTNAKGDPDVQVEAAGLSLIDTSEWSLTPVNDETSDFTLFDSTLLAYGDTSWGNPAQSGVGLVGYDLRGNELFHVLGGKSLSWIEQSGDLAYVVLGERRRIVVDAASGRFLERPRTRAGLSLVSS